MEYVCREYDRCSSVPTIGTVVKEILASTSLRLALRVRLLSYVHIHYRPWNYSQIASIIRFACSNFRVCMEHTTVHTYIGTHIHRRIHRLLCMR